MKEKPQLAKPDIYIKKINIQQSRVWGGNCQDEKPKIKNSGETEGNIVRSGEPTCSRIFRPLFVVLQMTFTPTRILLVMNVVAKIGGEVGNCLETLLFSSYFAPIIPTSPSTGAYFKKKQV